MFTGIPPWATAVVRDTSTVCELASLYPKSALPALLHPGLSFDEAETIAERLDVVRTDIEMMGVKNLRPLFDRRSPELGAEVLFTIAKRSPSAAGYLFVDACDSVDVFYEVVYRLDLDTTLNDKQLSLRGKLTEWLDYRLVPGSAWSLRHDISSTKMFDALRLRGFDTAGKALHGALAARTADELLEATRTHLPSSGNYGLLLLAANRFPEVLDTWLQDKGRQGRELYARAHRLPGTSVVSKADLERLAEEAYAGSTEAADQWRNDLSRHLQSGFTADAVEADGTVAASAVGAHLRGNPLHAVLLLNQATTIRATRTYGVDEKDLAILLDPNYLTPSEVARHKRLLTDMVWPDAQDRWMRVLRIVVDKALKMTESETPLSEAPDRELPEALLASHARNSYLGQSYSAVPAETYDQARALTADPVLAYLDAVGNDAAALKTWVNRGDGSLSFGELVELAKSGASAPASDVLDDPLGDLRF